ncbi:hypothetical protein KZJ38_16515 [Paraburkholderia edwinii]|jgi:signal transduction histidine kinase|uniref:histidine kinase n=1 Tax=Paraburkholderia edwinii TaxID=2861782 RepID=A0ABX8UG87_9BURK|nr:ATP-binding protein [Paraburkholderia edwinii]QYD67903.1 hypothetical protein KZJ38_16515 [Paraburkholderia edwinii]
MSRAVVIYYSLCRLRLRLTPEHLERLFEAFYTTKAAGMGMGLSICRSIVEAHGGRIWVSAIMPHGAAFQFTVPVQPGNALC